MLTVLSHYLVKVLMTDIGNQTIKINYFFSTKNSFGIISHHKFILFLFWTFSFWPFVIYEHYSHQYSVPFFLHNFPLIISLVQHSFYSFRSTYCLTVCIVQLHNIPLHIFILPQSCSMFVFVSFNFVLPLPTISLLTIVITFVYSKPSNFLSFCILIGSELKNTFIGHVKSIFLLII